MAGGAETWAVEQAKEGHEEPTGSSLGRDGKVVDSNGRPEDGDGETAYVQARRAIACTAVFFAATLLFNARHRLAGDGFVVAAWALLCGVSRVAVYYDPLWHLLRACFSRAHYPLKIALAYLLGSSVICRRVFLFSRGRQRCNFSPLLCVFAPAPARTVCAPAAATRYSMRTILVPRTLACAETKGAVGAAYQRLMAVSYESSPTRQWCVVVSYREHAPRYGRYWRHGAAAIGAWRAAAASASRRTAYGIKRWRRPQIAYQADIRR